MHIEEKAKLFKLSKRESLELLIYNLRNQIKSERDLGLDTSKTEKDLLQAENDLSNAILEDYKNI